MGEGDARCCRFADGDTVQLRNVGLEISVGGRIDIEETFTNCISRLVRWSNFNGPLNSYHGIVLK